MTYKVPKGWEEVKLGEVVVLNYGKALPQRNRVEGDIPVYSSAGITGTHNEHLVKGPGIIVGRKGTIGTVYYEEKNFYCIDTAFYIKPDKNYHFKYLYYLLLTLGLENLNTDTAVPGLNRNRAYAQNVLLPPLPEQKAIADTLSAIDDKIELNNKINQNLEAQAQAIFKSWFIDFEPFQDGEFVESELGMIPKGWEVIRLGDKFNFIKGRVPKYVDKNQPNAYPYLTKTVLDGNWDEIKYGIDSSGIRCEPLDILMMMDGASSSEVFYGYDGLVGSTLSLIDTEDSNMREILYMYFHIFNNELKNQNTGSAIPHANKDYINNIRIAIPSDTEYFKNLADFFMLIRIRILNNNNQNQKLAELRDTLLPKLISGEIRIPLDK